MVRARGAARLAALPLAALLASACAGPGTQNERTPVVVFAASSLTEAFTALAGALEQREPTLDVRLSLAGSQRLAAQLLDGAPADVFASANAEQMSVVERAGLLAGEPTAFAATDLAIVVEGGNPRSVEDLGDLAGSDLAVVLAGPEVPAGQYARTALERAGVSVEPVSVESDVRGVLTKVALGEADAGIVYRSDLLSAGEDLGVVGIPADQNVQAVYLLALIGEPSPGARAFVELVRSPEGRRILRRFGLETP